MTLRPLRLDASAPVPWRPGDAIWTVVLNLIGLFVITMGWLGASGAARLSHQYAWTAMGVIGLLFAGFGNGLWLLSGRRAVGARRHLLLAGRLGTQSGPRAHRQVSEPRVVESSLATDGVSAGGNHVIGNDMTRYHRRDCMLVRGKAVHPYEPGSNQNQDAQPCGICRP